MRKRVIGVAVAPWLDAISYGLVDIRIHEIGRLVPLFVGNVKLPEAMRVNGLDRERLKQEGKRPESVMTDAAQWVREIAGSSRRTSRVSTQL